MKTLCFYFMMQEQSYHFLVKIGGLESKKLVNPGKDLFDAHGIESFQRDNEELGKEAFKSVEKWIRKDNLFEKEKHWSLIVMCHLGELVTYPDVSKSRNAPCILHMNSMKGSHACLNGFIQSYLKEQSRGKVLKTSVLKASERDDISSRFDNKSLFISLELAYHSRAVRMIVLFSCSITYIEHFLEDALDHNFDPTRLKSDWLPPAQAFCKRQRILNLVDSLLKDKSELRRDDDDAKRDDDANGNAKRDDDAGCRPHKDTSMATAAELILTSEQNTSK